MKRIINLLYRDPQADLSGFKDEHVQSALTALYARLGSELNQTYRWLAACTVAVEAGRWGGNRRYQRRIKLLAMVNQCRVRLGLEPIAMEDNRWASVGLYYGYGAGEKYRTEHGTTLEHTLILGTLDSKGPKAAAFVAHHLSTFRKETDR